MTATIVLVPLPIRAVGLDAPALPGLTDVELTVSDVWATGVSPDSHPIQHLRERFAGNRTLVVEWDYAEVYFSEHDRAATYDDDTGRR